MWKDELEFVFGDESDFCSANDLCDYLTQFIEAISRFIFDLDEIIHKLRKACEKQGKLSMQKIDFPCFRNKFSTKLEFLIEKVWSTGNPSKFNFCHP